MLHQYNLRLNYISQADFYFFFSIQKVLSMWRHCCCNFNDLYLFLSNQGIPRSTFKGASPPIQWQRDLYPKSDSAPGNYISKQLTNCCSKLIEMHQNITRNNNIFKRGFYLFIFEHPEPCTLNQNHQTNLKCKYNVRPILKYHRLIRGPFTTSVGYFVPKGRPCCWPLD